MSQEYEALQAAVEANRSMSLPRYPLTVAVTNADIGEPAQPQLLARNEGGVFSAVSTAYPFKVTTRITPDSDPATLDRIVEFDSKLLTLLSPITEATITGLAEEPEPAVDDTGWELFIPDDTIWLEVGFTAGVASSWEIKSLGAGDTWADFDPGSGAAQCLVEWDGDGTSGDPYVTTKTRAVIARGPTDGGDPAQPRLVQVAHTDFILSLWDVDGKALYVLHPHSGGV